MQASNLGRGVTVLILVLGLGLNMLVLFPKLINYHNGYNGVMTNLVCVCIRRLLYSDCSRTASIVWSCNLTAENCQVLMNRTRCVQDLHYDADVNTLYWVEANIINSFNLVERRAQFIASVSR